MGNYLIIKNANFGQNGFNLLTPTEKSAIVANEQTNSEWYASRSISVLTGGVITWSTRDDLSCILCPESDVFSKHPTVYQQGYYPVALPSKMQSITFSFTDSTTNMSMIFVNENGIRIHDTGWKAAEAQYTITPSNFDFPGNYDQDGITYIVFNIKKGRPTPYDVDDLGLTVSITY